jgi:hypothetical protein
MKAILFLKEMAEPISSNLQRPKTQEGEAMRAPTCDRWGHPSGGCVEPKPQAGSAGPKIFVSEKVR